MTTDGVLFTSHDSFYRILAGSPGTAPTSCCAKPPEGNSLQAHNFGDNQMAGFISARITERVLRYH